MANHNGQTVCMILIPLQNEDQIATMIMNEKAKMVRLPSRAFVSWLSLPRTVPCAQRSAGCSTHYLHTHVGVRDFFNVLLLFRCVQPFKREAFYGNELSNSDNLAQLKEMTEEAIVHETKKRYEIDVIYTWIGDVLVAINPFKALNIYGKKFQELFLLGTPTIDIPPHIFAVAQNSFKALQHTEHNQ